MQIKFGRGKTEFGPGVSIQLTAEEVATAIDAYIVAHGKSVHGPRTITTNGCLIDGCHIYVDPSGFLMHNGQKWTGRGEIIR
jgi:hypothetical protein